MAAARAVAGLGALAATVFLAALRLGLIGWLPASSPDDLVPLLIAAGTAVRGRPDASRQPDCVLAGDDRRAGLRNDRPRGVRECGRRVVDSG